MTISFEYDAVPGGDGRARRRGWAGEAMDQAFEVPLVGSSASRSASPLRETEVSSAMRNPAGKRKSQGRETTAGVQSCSRVLSDTSGVWMHRQTYDCEISEMLSP